MRQCARRFEINERGLEDTSKCPCLLQFDSGYID